MKIIMKKILSLAIIILLFSISSAKADHIDDLNSTFGKVPQSVQQDAISQWYKMGILAKAFEKCNHETLSHWKDSLKKDEGNKIRRGYVGLMHAFENGYNSSNNGWANDSCSALQYSLSLAMAGE
jgi:opacity protein-like surface antigen